MFYVADLRASLTADGEIYGRISPSVDMHLSLQSSEFETSTRHIIRSLHTKFHANRPDSQPGHVQSNLHAGFCTCPVIHPACYDRLYTHCLAAHWGAIIYYLRIEAGFCPFQAAPYVHIEGLCYGNVDLGRIVSVRSGVDFRLLKRLQQLHHFFHIVRSPFWLWR